jgi:hypothetical protein
MLIKAAVIQVFKNFSAFYGTWMFITMFALFSYGKIHFIALLAASLSGWLNVIVLKIKIKIKN